MKVFVLAALLLGFLSANSLDQIKKDRLVRIGVYNDQPPFSALVDGKYRGFEIALGEKLGKEIFGDNPGKVKFIPITASRRISALQRNEADMVIATFTPTPTRAKKIDFSEPYFKVQVGVLAKKDENVTSFDQLRKKRIFVIKHSPIHNFLRKAGFRKNLNFCASSAKCYRAFKRAKNAVHVDDNLILHAYAIIDNKSQVALDGLGKQTYNAIAVQKGNNALLELINKSLAGLKKDGFLDKTFDDTLGIFYHGTIDKKEFLVE